MLTAQEPIPDRSRAALDPRWNQDLISRASILIVGQAAAANLAALAAAGMGFRKVAIASTVHGLVPRVAACFRSDSIARLARERYPDVAVARFDHVLPGDVVRSLFGEPDVVIALLGGISDQQVIDAASLVRPERRIFVRMEPNGIRVAVGQVPGGRDLALNVPMEVCLLAASLGLSEARRLVAPCGEDTELAGEVVFRMDAPPGPVRELRIAGAGGTGNWMALVGRFMERRMRIFDHDTVALSNIPRCPWLSNLGANKAVDLARNLSTSFHGIAPVIPVAERAGPEWLDGAPDGCVAAFCTDSLSSRRVLNEAACRRGVPAVNMGTSIFGASVYAISAGSQCMECRFPNLDSRVAAEAEADHLDNCCQRAEPAAAIANMIAAGLAGMVARRLTAPGFSFPGVVTWDAFAPSRLWTGSVRPACSCLGRGGGDGGQ